MKKKWNLQNPLARKQLAALLSLALVMLCFVGTTLAYVIAKAGPITNLFQPVQVSCLVSNDQKTVENTSNIPVYLRIAVTATYEKTEDGKVVTHWQNPNLEVKPDSSWSCVDVVIDEVPYHFYYFNRVVAVDEIVDWPVINVTGETPDGYQTVTHVLAEVIQSEPDDAVQGAWEMTFSNGTWSAVGGN